MFAGPEGINWGNLWSEWELAWPTGHKVLWGLQQLLAGKEGRLLK
jgi:hypothetical protein